MITYESANEAKSNFNDVYLAPTPHAYFGEMHRLRYAIGQEARPYFKAAVALLRRQLPTDATVRMFDLGCSYGVGSALVKYGFSFAEIADFFADKAEKDFRGCVKDMRHWLDEASAVNRLTCIGADSSAPAIKFAIEAGLIEDGIAHDFEADPKLDDRECELVKAADLLISTGTIGYVGEKTLSTILRKLGEARPTDRVPLTVVTILRMFTPEPITTTFANFGYRFEAVPGVRLRQRRFDNEHEQKETMRLVRARGLDPTGWESTGYLYADLFIGARPDSFAPLLSSMQDVARRLGAVNGTDHSGN